MAVRRRFIRVNNISHRNSLKQSTSQNSSRPRNTKKAVTTPTTSTSLARVRNKNQASQYTKGKRSSHDNINKSRSSRQSLALRMKPIQSRRSDTKTALKVPYSELNIPCIPDGTLSRHAISKMNGFEISSSLLNGAVSFRRLGDTEFPLPVRCGDRPQNSRTAFVHFVAYCRDMGRLKSVSARAKRSTIRPEVRSVGRSSDLAQAWLAMNRGEREPFRRRERDDRKRYSDELHIFTSIVDSAENL